MKNRLILMISLLHLVACKKNIEDTSEAIYQTKTEDVQEYSFEETDSIIQGYIKAEKHFGPPGYGQTPDQDKLEQSYILILDNEIMVVEPSSESPSLNRTTCAMEVHLSPRNGIHLEEGQHIKVKGQFFSAHTGHHRRELLMDVYEVFE